MRRRFPDRQNALFLIAGLCGALALVASLMASGDAQAAKVRKKPKVSTGSSPSGSPSSGSPSASSRKDPLPPIRRTKLYDVCPQEMVNVRGQFCIDRWEASIVDVYTGQPGTAYYPPHAGLAMKMQDRWVREYLDELDQARALMLEAGFVAPPELGVWGADPSKWLNALEGRTGVVGSAEDGANASFLPSADAPHGWVLLGDLVEGGDSYARPRRPLMMLPPLYPWQGQSTFKPKAVSQSGVVPQGYTPGFVADPVCREAGKRLCREEEWVMACKGEKQTKFPYGNSYQQGRCNVFRQSHPGMILHGNWSTGLSDPRLNLVRDVDGPMLRVTGETLSCRSVWGDDGVFDMVGNVDEWVDDPGGVFVGGFYARNTRNGCESRVSSHPVVYFDYSLGFRCCADLVAAP
ncbi:MAG: formylglycine-generating enzyme family protein [Polyangiaceae bacterium]|nr:formylglycine-generating enzyme family protein [Polyangiaceae bacterium]